MQKSSAFLLGLTFFSSVLFSDVVFAFDHSHGEWSKILKEHVKVTDEGRITRLNYAALKKSPRALEAYTKGLSKVSEAEFAAFSFSERKAFLVNAYNAFIVKLVVDNYPLKSIKSIGIPFVGPWKSSFIPLLGKNLSPDDVEHGLLRKKYPDPRIHVAVNCASVSCPALRPEAFVAAKLDEQLEEQARLFYSNPREAAFFPATRELKLNSILKWFKEDFVSPGDSSPVTYVAKYLPSLAQELASGRVRAADVNVRFQDYDWGLNDSI
jgi:hypothetical protein